jgi:uncharacterized PurR-regulated membrane protein YhhQ (DUF165 family)
MLPLAAVEAGLLLEVVWVSLVSGVVVTTLFSLVVRFGARSAEARRGGGSSAATLYAGLALFSFLAFAFVVVFGVQVMLTK